MLQIKMTPNIDPTVSAYIVNWLYGEDPMQQALASNTYAKLKDANGYYDKLKLKLKDATNPCSCDAPTRMRQAQKPFRPFKPLRKRIPTPLKTSKTHSHAACEALCVGFL